MESNTYTGTNILDESCQIRNDRQAGVCLVIYAYGDDGSDEKHERVAAVSIVAGYEDWWQQLDWDWVQRCGGRPFHATDCECDKGAFAPEFGREDETHRENKELYRDLTAMLAASPIGGIGVAIDLKAQMQIFPNSLPIAYFRALVECFERAANVAEYAGDVCEVTYDISKENAYNAGQLYAWLRESDQRLCSLLHPKLSFVSWRDSARVQAADLLAYEAWKALDHTVGSVRRTRKSWDALRATQRFETYSYSSDWFHDLKKHIELGELKKASDFSEADYRQWLMQGNRRNSMSNIFSFIRSVNEPRTKDVPSRDGSNPASRSKSGKGDDGTGAA